MEADLKSAVQGEVPSLAIQQASPQNCLQVLIQTAAKAARLDDNEGLAAGLEEIQKKQQLFLPGMLVKPASGNGARDRALGVSAGARCKAMDLWTGSPVALRAPGEVGALLPPRNGAELYRLECS